MLWPDLERKAALTNLRQVLQNLRQAINIEGRVDHPLQVSRESIWLCPSADLEIDLAEFSAPSSVCPATLCPADCSPCLAQMEALAGRYQGEFMAGFSLVESPEYEEWLRVHREALHLRILMLLARLSECQEHFGAYGKSLSFAQRFLGLDPWNEDGLRRVMRLFALNGQRASAIRAYTTCCQELKRASREGRAPPTTSRVGEDCSSRARWRDSSAASSRASSVVSSQVESGETSLSSTQIASRFGGVWASSSDAVSAR